MSESAHCLATLERLKKTFQSGKTKSFEWRVSQLQAIKRMCVENEIQFKEALTKDLGRGDFESYGLEILPSIMESDFMVSHLHEWMRPTYTSVPGIMAPATAEITYEPYGVCLVISAFNYPLQLSLGPLLGAICAGNCCVLKPSEMASATEKCLAEIIPRYLDNDCFAVICGSIPTTTALLEQRWDKIFFTGSTRVGKIVMSAAAKHLIPVSLELGGKSPTFVDDSVTDLALVAQRICWGKFTNAGQTCIAPDYIICHEKVYDGLLKEMTACLKRFYGENPQQSGDLSRIISTFHVERLKSMLDEKPGNIVVGGQVDIECRYVAPTIVTNVRPGSKIMSEEIFGPLLPIIKVSKIEEGIEFIKGNDVFEKPLALYIYGKNRKVIDHIIHSIPSGGVLVNDCLFHFGNSFVPFGGVGPSGLGGYHGKFSFECFSHRRSIMRRDDHMILDAPIRYPPYTKSALKAFKLAAGLPPIPPVQTIVRTVLMLGAVATGAFLAHQGGFVDVIKTYLS